MLFTKKKYILQIFLPPDLAFTIYHTRYASFGLLCSTPCFQTFVFPLRCDDTYPRHLLLTPLTFIYDMAIEMCCWCSNSDNIHLIDRHCHQPQILHTHTCKMSTEIMTSFTFQRKSWRHFKYVCLLIGLSVCSTIWDHLEIGPLLGILPSLWDSDLLCESYI